MEKPIEVVRNHVDGTGLERVAARRPRVFFGASGVDTRTGNDEEAHWMNLMKGWVATALALCGLSGLLESALKAQQSA